MYCRKCRNLLDDTDQYCRKCGEPTGFHVPDKSKEDKSKESIESAEEVVLNPPITDKVNNNFLFFNEESELNKTAADSKKIELPKNNEFVWDVHDFSTQKKIEDIEFNWNLDEYRQPGIKEETEPMLEETLFREIKDESNKSSKSKIDRFYTFNKKNEEFQKLLDKEYERLKGIRSGENLEETYKKNLQNLEPIFFDKESELSFEDKESVSLVDENITSNISAVEDEAEATISVSEEVIDPTVPVTEDEQGKAASSEDNRTEQVSYIENITEQDILDQVGEPETAAKEEHSELINEEENNLKVNTPRAEHLDEMSKARSEYFADGKANDNVAKEQSNDRDIENKKVKDLEEAQETNGVNAAESTASEQNPISHEEESVEETKNKRNSLGRVILIIIAIILAIEIAILGIRYFAPDSAMAKFINNAQSQIIRTVTGWFISDDDIDPTSGEGPEAIDESNDKDDEVVEPPEITPEPDPKPMEDKDALISSQMGNNKNIINVRSNETLAYQAGRDYGFSGINNSKPIENNIWKAPEGEDPVYYDQSIVGTIIAFDSQWIDYVNGDGNSVLNLLKKDSKAYRNAVNFSKVGKVKETFQLLEIGEIRKGSNGFYVWTHEEIQIIENGKTSNLKYNWIYHLEPIDGEMKIVNYIKY